jgi:hypothetical protein
MNHEHVVVLFTVVCVGLFIYAAFKVPQCPRCGQRRVEILPGEMGDGSNAYCHGCGSVHRQKIDDET